MKFIEAKEKLKIIAKGKYHSLRYELTEHTDGEQVVRTALYIDGLDHFSGPTWEDAFRRIEEGTPPVADLTGAPE